jgi:cobalt-zinc-cadmium efflux system membrane fusion protein
MSIAVPKIGSDRRRLGQVLSWSAMGISLAALAGYVAYDHFGWTHVKAPAVHAMASPANEGPPTKSAGTAPATTVTLSEDKFKAAEIATEPARYDQIATDVGVVGVIQVNLDRQVVVRPRAAGIVRKVHVQLGQSVRRGDPLITLDSPDVGTARLNLRAKQRELATARFEADWKSQIAANVTLLIPELLRALNLQRMGVAGDNHAEQAGPTANDHAALIEKEFADKPLGTYRGTLLQALADYEIARHEEVKTASLKNLNIMGQHPALVARHTREGVQAKLEAAIEQVRFDSAQEKRLADQQARLAESAVVDAAQRLRILGVSEDIANLLAHADVANRIAIDEDVTVYEIVAPIEGTIIKRSDFAVATQKADLNDVLFNLADLRSVWVTANVPESDVAKLPKIKNGSFRLTATAYLNGEFSARLLSVGAMVDPQTRTVPVLAQTDNLDGLFKLGMFVRLNLGSSATETALTVPASAIAEIENVKYVFVPAEMGAQNRSFRLHSVECGRKIGNRIVIKSGLKKGDVVVSTGAFLLKSELILQSQEDEE